MLRVVLVLAMGLGVGALTAILQTYFNAPWDSLVNAVSPWVTPMFVVGALWDRLGRSGAAGLSTGLLELLGYYLTDVLRGYAVGAPMAEFWIVCAVVGGFLFGAAGWAWRRARGWRGYFGAAALPSIFFAEAVVSYGLRLHYWSSAALFFALGTLALVLLGLHRHNYRHLAASLLVAITAGVAGELMLGAISSQPFLAR